jgi:hypothetical protein
MITGWVSGRSGSRVSIHNPVRRVLRALSLSRNPMPPRITRKSDRRKVSDRTMVGTAQPLCLSALGTNGRRYESTMNPWRSKTQSVSLHYWGWSVRPFFRALTAVREVFVLTSPFIERRYRNVANARHSIPSPISQSPLSIAPCKLLTICARESDFSAFENHQFVEISDVGLCWSFGHKPFSCELGSTELFHNETRW